MLVYFFAIWFNFNSLSAFIGTDDPTLEKVATQNATGEIFLKYQHAQSDYLIFYDRHGSLLLLRYRRDKWDYDNNVLRDNLVRGITYKVKFSGMKKLSQKEIPAELATNEVSAGTTRKIRDFRSVFLAQLTAVRESALRDLRL